MKSYKVLVSALTGTGNKIHRHPSIITAAHLEEKNIPSLIKDGFIEEVEEKKVEKKTQAKKK